MINKSSMYARKILRDAIRSIILAWNMSAEPPKPMGSLLYEYFPQGEDDCTHLGCRWVQPDGVVAHFEMKTCGISEAF
jgi:hypothetical protein